MENNNQHIIYNSDSNTINLNTKNSTYQIKIAAEGVVLHTWYGERVDNLDFSYLFEYQENGMNPISSDGSASKYSYDALPQEFPQRGTGDYRVAALDLLWPNGTRASDLRYHSHEISQGKYELEGLPSFWQGDAEAETLELVLKDKVSDVYVHLYYAVFPKLDLITRASKVVNRGTVEVYVNKLASAAIDFRRGDYELITFPGAHENERQAEATLLPSGIYEISSKRGMGGHQQNPAVILKDPTTDEKQGQAYAFALVYSGGFTFEFEKDQYKQTRLVMGLDADNLCWKLEQDEELTAPELVMTYSNSGIEKLTHNLHDGVNNNLIRSKYAKERRPILVNNWEATYFDFDKESLLNIVKTAAELDVELFVLDDGWFGNRDWEDKALGDWKPNTDKLGGNLEDLVKEINDIGLDLGIWIEPEMISENSDLYRAHPEWAIAVPGREPKRFRQQLVLDMTREDVKEYIKSVFDRILQNTNIHYVKWDMNRSLSDLYGSQLPADEQGKFSHKFMLSVYEIFEYLHETYPDVMIESCASGGGRFDLGMLYYTPQIWTSDNTDAIERLKIQHGTSFVYPISSISAHVSASPNHQNRRTTDIATRGLVAMQGAFGYELDLSKLDNDDKEEIKKQIAFYREHWELIQQGDYYRLTNPQTDKYYTVWEYVSKDKTKGLLAVVYKDVKANALSSVVHWRGLDPNVTYKIKEVDKEFGTISGDALMQGGQVIRRAEGNYDAIYYLIEKV